MPTEVKKSAIAVGNIITGIYNFLIISIPFNWRIAEISMSSDVFYSIYQGNVKWVTEGEIEHLLQTRTATASFRIRIKRGLKDKNKFKNLKLLTSSQNVMFSTHKAEVYHYEEKFLWKKRNVLGVFFYCEDTQRTILIEFINGNSWIEEILDFQKESQCHLSKNFEQALNALDIDDERFKNYT